MAQRYIIIEKLDLYRRNNKEFICVQEDNILLEANIFENGVAMDLENKLVYVEAVDSKNQLDPINKAKVKINGNNIKCELNEDLTNFTGVAKLQITIKSDIKQISSFPIYLNVTELISEGKEIQEEYEKISKIINNKLIYLEEQIELLKAKFPDSNPTSNDLEGGSFSDVAKDIFDCGIFTDTNIIKIIDGGAF